MANIDDIEQNINNNSSNQIELGNINSTKDLIFKDPENLKNNGDEKRFDDFNEPISINSKKSLEPLRSEVVFNLELRKRRLDRQAIEMMPEIHFIGEVSHGRGIINDFTEGALCRWKIDFGKTMNHLGGDLFGSTQISYCKFLSTENIVFNHPIDLHFSSAGLQGWGSPIISLQTYRLDWHGRRILSGYGFTHLPLLAGQHTIDVCLWRPMGNTEQELTSFLLGHNLSLLSHEVLYETAWKDRCRLVTVSAGQVVIKLNVVKRFFSKHDIDENPYC